MTAGATGLGIVTTGEVATDATDREVAAAAGAGIAEVARRPAPLGRVAGPAEIGVETGFVRSVTAATLPGAMNASAAVPRSQSEGRAKKNKSRTGSAKDERTQIWPVES